MAEIMGRWGTGMRGEGQGWYWVEGLTVHLSWGGEGNLIVWRGDKGEKKTHGPGKIQKSAGALDRFTQLSSLGKVVACDMC